VTAARDIPAAPPKFGHAELVAAVDALRARWGRAAMDRRRVLDAVCRELGADEATVLRRGFDKAYRQIVEGI